MVDGGGGAVGGITMRRSLVVEIAFCIQRKNWARRTSVAELQRTLTRRVEGGEDIDMVATTKLPK